MIILFSYLYICVLLKAIHNFPNHLTPAYENVVWFYKSTESYKGTASWFIFRRFVQFIERMKESAISGTLKSLFSCMVWEF